MTGIRVALADDHPIVLAGLKSLIQSAPGMEFVGEATNGKAALQMIRAMMPDVAIIDISMPEISGVELAQRLAEECRDTKILVLTVHQDRAYMQRLLQAGARGYLLKRSAAAELVRAIQAIFDGGLYIDPMFASKLLSPATLNNVNLGEVGLSEREEEVLKLAARGFSNKESAAQLNLSIKTVETYRARATEKLGLKNRIEIVRYGAVRGWLSDS